MTAAPASPRSRLSAALARLAPGQALAVASLLAVLAVPAVLIALPRSPRLERRTTALDALVTGASAAVVVWLLRAQRSAQHLPPATSALAALALLAVCTLAATAVLVALARRRAGRGALLPEDRAVRSGALTSAAVTASAVLAVALTAGPGGAYLDAASGSLLCLVVITGALRELLLRRGRAQLVGDLRRQVLTDDLTGLPNRRALVELLERERTAPDGPTVVVKLGLDSFYEYNAQFGSACGDAALRTVARVLRETVPTGWTVHRTGGDQFLLRGPGSAADGRVRAEAALAAVRSASLADERPLTASAGVAEAVPGATDPAAVLSDAAAALRATKARCDGGVGVHDAALVERTRRQHQVAAALREALAADALAVGLQPVVDIASGATTGFELLSRWTDPQLGVVSPEEYVPVAEAAGLVHQLGGCVLRKGLQAHVAAGGVERRLRVAVNASVHELRRCGYADGVRAAAGEAGVPLDLLTVEVTESVFLARDDPAAPTLRELQEAGVRLAIDDFGTGYSSLGYLDRLPVTYVKVDRSLVVAATASERSRALLSAVVAVSRSLDLEVVAEGIEEEAQARMVLDLGVRLGQGWLWSRALAPEQLLEHLAAPPRALGQGPDPAADSGQGDPQQAVVAG
ncbi:bifunctional diguanylate cyclase/phosphodiesterase [Streptomyces sp. NP160]|uniref:bifunctional diguanylate cyclase/phosphodiesterase n=1 Tax=Streptomyces sp. NP160 TaxID=2586637 RepID=UPI0015D60B23|nr:bifunctional diguanylate cyclase/phosphodiesterase [Streptomyces sp. NP160]